MGMAVFHEGEVEVQRRLGVPAGTFDFNSSAIRDYMKEQHRDFFSEQPFFLFATLGADAQPWPSLLVYDAADSPDEKTLRLRRVRPLPGDRLVDNLKAGTEAQVQFGGLGIQFHTRRRNRLNGVVDAVEYHEDGSLDLKLHAVHSFGNCPKYIQARHITRTTPRHPEATVTAMETATATAMETATETAAATAAATTASMTERVQAIVSKADTFFIASGRPDLGADMSHRGGSSGFVRVLDETTLEWPDYRGNQMYQTLGNLSVQPRAALLVPDFDSGDLAVLLGKAELLYEKRDAPEALRTVRFSVSQVVLAPKAMPFEWAFRNASPYNPPAVANAVAETFDDGAIPLKLISKTPEAADVQTFTFETDVPVRHEAGQYATLQFLLGGRKIVRTWTVSSAEGGEQTRRFQISVKRAPGGQVTPWMLETLKPGDETRQMIALTSVGGDFTLQHAGVGADGADGATSGPEGAGEEAATSPHTLLFIAGGIGITPFMSMLRTLAARKRRGEAVPAEKIVLLYAARTHADLAFAEELDALTSELPNFAFTALLSREEPKRRIDVDLLRQSLGADALADESRGGVRVFMCGPMPMQRSLTDALVGELGVSDTQIHSDSFEF